SRPRASSRPWSSGTSTAPSQAAPACRNGATRTTCSGGPGAVTPTSTRWHCSASSTTPTSTCTTSTVRSSAAMSSGMYDDHAPSPAPRPGIEACPDVAPRRLDRLPAPGPGREQVPHRDHADDLVLVQDRQVPDPRLEHPVGDLLGVLAKVR